MAMTKGQLKEMIIDLRMQVVQMSIPKGHCPYAYYGLENAPNIDCNEIGCSTCHAQFNQIMRERITKEVKQL